MMAIRTEYLVCPVCGSGMFVENNSLKCMASRGGKTHCFDISASGYCDLSHRNGGGGDPKSAVADRTAFLDKGYYEPLSGEICRLVRKYASEVALIADAGCGEGYYSESVASQMPKAFVFGADLSKHAVHRASVRRKLRGDTNSFYAVASVFDLPVASNSCDLAISMFAPVAEDEMKRILKPGGILLIGAAGRDHLFDLKQSIYEEVRINDQRADLPEKMELVESTRISYRITMDNNEDVQRLFGMTPYKFRTSKESFEKLLCLDHLDVGVDVEFFVYKNV